jgi:hypothetical protein
MDYQISALSISQFEHLLNADEETLRRAGALRMEVTANPGYPCRVSLEDAEPGESVLLIHYEHQAVATPYRSSHAIFIRENAEQAKPFINEIPEQLRIRLLSIRGFGKDGMMRNADVVHGSELEPAIKAFLDDDEIEYLHLHNAKPGCYAARVDRLQ